MCETIADSDIIALKKHPTKLGRLMFKKLCLKPGEDLVSGKGFKPGTYLSLELSYYNLLLKITCVN